MSGEEAPAVSVDSAFVGQEVERLADEIVARLHDAGLVANPACAIPVVEQVLVRALRDLAEVTSPTIKGRLMQIVQHEMQIGFGRFLTMLAGKVGQTERQHLEAQLTPTQLEILRLLEFEGLRLREAADRMGMKLDHLNDHMRRGAKAVGVRSVKTLRQGYRAAFAESVDEGTTRM